ncbi:MAG: hypothetical protein QXJ36_06535 [Desulfurococcaceae archaeon]
MIDNKLFLILLTLLLMSIINIDTHIADEKQISIQQQAYFKAVQLKNETLIDLPFTNSYIYIFQDLNNDSINEIYAYFPYEKLCILDGDSFTLWTCIDLINKTLDSIVPIGDHDNDGVSELILITSEYNQTANKTIISIFYANPYENTFELKNEISFDGLLYQPKYYIVNPFNVLTIYDESSRNISTIYISIVRIGELYRFLSVKVSYNIEENTYFIEKNDNVVYTMYTDTVIGDLDNDGVIEVSKDYRIIMYTVVQNYILTSYVEIYYKNKLIFRREESMVNLYAFLTYNGRELIVSILKLKMIGATSLLLEGYRLDNTVLFTYSIPTNLVMLQFIPLGDSLLITSCTSGEQGYSSNITLISTVNGKILYSRKMNVISRYLIGLGNVENDDYKEVLFIYIDENNVTYYKVLKVKNTVVFFDLYDIELRDQTPAVLNIYEVNGVNYLITYIVEDNNTVLMLYKIEYYGDTTPPVISITSPKPNEYIGKLPYYVIGTARDPESGIAIIEVYLVSEDGLKIDLNVNYDPQTGIFEAIIPENTPSGVYTLVVNSTNGIGLSSIVELTITIDLVLPLVSIELPTRYDIYIDVNKIEIINGNASFTISLNLSDIMLNLMRIFINNTEIYSKLINDRTYSDSIKITLSEGKYLLKIYVDDRAGNSIIEERLIIIDLSKPIVEKLNVNITSYTQEYVNLTISYRVRDVLSGVEKIEIIVDNVSRVIDINDYIGEGSIDLNNIPYTSENITVVFKAWDRAGWCVTESRLLQIPKPPVEETTTPLTETTPVLTETPTPPPAEGFNWLPIIIIIVIIVIIGVIVYLFKLKK